MRMTAIKWLNRGLVLLLMFTVYVWLASEPDGHIEWPDFGASAGTLIILFGFGLLLGAALARFRAASRKQLQRQLFTASLRSCVELQVPLVAALADSSGLPADEGRMFDRTCAGLTAGRSLAESLRGEWDCLPAWHVKLIELGERLGNLCPVLRRLEELDAAPEKAREQWANSLFYPLGISLAILPVFILLEMSIVPRYEVFYQDLDLRRVWPFSYSPWQWDLLLAWFGAAVVGLLLAGVVAPVPWGRNWEARCGRNWFGANWVRALRWRLPFFGPRYRRAATARWAGLVGLLLETGIDLPGALRAAEELELDANFQRHAQQWRVLVEAGQSISETLGDCRWVPASLKWRIGVAERHGDLPGELAEGARQLTAELRRETGAVLRLAGLFYVLFLGGVVGLFGLRILGHYLQTVETLMAQ